MELESAFADSREAENAPQRERRADAPDNYSEDLRRRDRRRADDARPSPHPRRQLDQREPDEQRGVTNRAEDDKHRDSRHLQGSLAARRPSAIGTPCPAGDPLWFGIRIFANLAEGSASTLAEVECLP
jgi:hypothetical protein